MLWFNHPKPFLQRPVAMQLVACRAQALPDLRVLIVETRALPAVFVIHPGPADPRDVSRSRRD